MALNHVNLLPKWREPSFKYMYLMSKWREPLCVGIYRVSFVYQELKVTSHKQITNKYTSIITWLKPLKRETIHALSQCGHFREFINIKIKVTYVYLINGYWTNDPPCSLNRDHGTIGC